MHLHQLAWACHIYKGLTSYDKGYLSFLNETKNSLDLDNKSHVLILISWLNKWGCRQFAKNDHDLASTEILDWYKNNKNQLPLKTKILSELTLSEIRNCCNLYESLRELTASKRKLKNKTISVRVGPTGASKILFALRPHIFTPWDIPIRKKFSLSESKGGYILFLGIVKAEINKLEIECREFNIEVNNIPSRIKRPNSSLNRLIDEYFWVTISKNLKPPDKELLKQWVAWSI